MSRFLFYSTINGPSSAAIFVDLLAGSELHRRNLSRPLKLRQCNLNLVGVL